MASGSIVVANDTNVNGLVYTISGDASGYPVVCSGSLTNSYPGNEVKCAVSGYDTYYVSIGPFGENPPTNAWLDHVDATKSPQLTFAVDID